MVVAAQLHLPALDLGELGHDRRLVAVQALPECREALRQPGVIGLAGQLASPVLGQVEVAATVVELADGA